jgi:hypothetical protein
MNISLAAVVPSTIRPPWSVETGIQQGPEEQQETKSATSDMASSTNATKSDEFTLYVNPDSSKMYMAYLFEFKNVLYDRRFSEIDTKEVEPSLSNQSAVFRIPATEDFLDRTNEFKTAVQLLETLHKLAKYEVETKELQTVTNVLNETSGNSSLVIVLIPLNRTKNVIEEINESLHGLHLMTISPTRWTHIWVDNVTTNPKVTHLTQVSLQYNLAWRKSEEYEILTHYVSPALYLIILVVGLLGNGMLLLLFIRHRELRTTANVMIINLAVCDILNLGINAPLHSIFHFEGGSPKSILLCRFVLAFRQFLRGTGALAVLALIIQRFIIIRCTSPRPRSPFFLIILPILTVWVLPAPIAWPTIYLPDFYGPICTFEKKEGKLSYTIVLSFFFYSAVMPIIMFGCSTQIARRLTKSVKDIPGENRHWLPERMRKRSARMTLALAVVFLITYVPFQVWVLLARWVRLDKHQPSMVYALYFTKIMLFANGCFNPIALFTVSTVFRRLFVRYLCCPAKQRVYSTKL